MLLAAHLVALTLTSAPAPEAVACGRVVFLLQHLAAEYPEAVEYEQSAELERQALLLEDAEESARRVSPELARQLAALRSKVRDGSDPDGVTGVLRTLPATLLAQCGLPASPPGPLNLARAARRYQEACASCHGPDGKARTAAAAVIDPPPAVLGDPDLMEELTPLRAFGALSHGIPTTAMPAFETLSEHERWELAHYVFTFRHAACPDDAPRPAETLASLSASSDGDLFARAGTTELGCHRAQAFTAPVERDLNQRDARGTAVALTVVLGVLSLLGVSVLRL